VADLDPPRRPARPGSGGPGQGVPAFVLADESAGAKVLVKAAAGGGVAASLGVPFGQARPESGGVLAVGSGPGEWLLLGPAGAGPALVERWRAEPDDGLVTVLDATAGRTVLRLAGASSGAALAKVCGVDLASAADGADGAGAAVRTSVARVPALVVRDGDGFLVVCERSYGEYLAGALLDAGTEFGIVTEKGR
jgi:heterotetrameric sarcosine oxidase gamma subunit